MAQDIMSQFYTCLNLPLHEKLMGLTRIIDQSPPNKELQTIFPQLISNIFSSSFNNGWGIRSFIVESNRDETSALLNFLEPQGPMFRLCYKLLSDPQLRYNLPLNSLPLDLQMTLERGRCPQFYADMLSMDTQSMNVVALALNPFDYYIFHFALDLLNNNQNKKSWESGSSVYAALVCDYLQQFLPLDPNNSVLPLIPQYAGKVPIAAPLQTANWPLCSPSLLLIPDLSGMNNQHTSPQSQSRNEVWRTETVVQIFIDLWMSIEQFNANNVNMPVMSTSPERVRIVRIMVKHIHAFSTKYQNDPAVRSSTLRKYARQIMCARGYQYVKHLVTIWPLDASFRIVIEIWLSLIQPWRYTSDTINHDRFANDPQYQEESNNTPLDYTFIQFIAENFPSYTCILQLILPRFMRLDLAAYKNSVMLFRLGKVFSQPHLIPILWNLEQAITDNTSGLHHSMDNSYNNSNLEQSYTYNGIALNKWVGIAKQAISELNMSATFEYHPVWGENRKAFAIEFVKRIISAKIQAEKKVEDYQNSLTQQSHGFWQSVCKFLMLDENPEERASIEEFKKAPLLLNNCINYFSHIFGLNDSIVHPLETEMMDVTLENSSFSNSSFAYSIASKLRTNPTGIHYMGDPDLMPIASYENTILVRMLHQIASRLNEVYGETFTSLWNRDDLLGHLAREVLQKPMRVQRYVKDVGNHQTIVNEDLPPRLSLRRLGSHVFIVWFIIGYIVLRFFSYSGIFYIFCLVFVWTVFVFFKASLKRLKLLL